MAANKILREKSFFAYKKGFYGLAESGRAHKRDGRGTWQTNTPLPSTLPSPPPNRGEGERGGGEVLAHVQFTCVRVKIAARAHTHTRASAARECNIRVDACTGTAKIRSLINETDISEA